MQSETLDAHSEPSNSTRHQVDATTAQYGLPRLLPDSPLLGPFDEHNSNQVSGSEWSMSSSLSESHDAWLGARRSGSHEEDTSELSYEALSGTVELDRSASRLKNASKPGSNRSPLLEIPEEMLFHVISYLSADDLLTVKLVSRRFNDLVNSPHAWINAFAKYFLGGDALTRTADMSGTEADSGDLKSEKRSFTRLGATASWTSEYLLRTKLLRCLARGRPAVPFAAPSPGKANKGYATFTFNSRLRFGISHLHAKFGAVLDKRLPQFIHGLDSHGTVSTSDKRGKFDGWGLIERISFQDFAESYPGSAQWGSGSGDVVGVPNVMDVSSSFGMVYGEGTPGGYVYFLSTGEKHGRYLAPFLNSSKHELGMPRVSQDLPSVCSVWIAKAASVPRITKGIVGILSGSSNGIVTAFSAGSMGDHQQRSEKGELTARWILSPGVPIIAIMADDNFSEERCSDYRIWAVAVNALGEVFTLDRLPLRAAARIDAGVQAEMVQEIRAWETGSTVTWKLVRASQRSERFSRLEMKPTPNYYPPSVWEREQVVVDQAVVSMREVESWLSKRASEIKADFDGWDMRRRVEVDFAGDDGKGAGEAVFVFDCGFEDGQPAAVRRFVRCAPFKAGRHIAPDQKSEHKVQLELSAAQTSIFNNSSWSFDAEATCRHQAPMSAQPASHQTSSAIERAPERVFEWRFSNLLFGRSKTIQVSTTSIDMSSYAIRTGSEDTVRREGRAGDSTSSEKARSLSVNDDYSAFRVPGQRARFIAAGTNTGSIYLWDARSPPAASTGLVNTIRPIRVIDTDSPDISALALSALYLVHGGSEGLVQAWDVLASTLAPVRTISSRTTLNARRRAVIAAQSNPALQVQMSMSNYAATAICLDPDPTILRGIVAIGSHLRYWSFSSTAAADMTKSQKRKMNRAAEGLNASSGESFPSTRRVSLKGFVNQEVAQCVIEEKERKAEAKEERRLAGRFGLNLLGDDASEEELLAYAKLLSEEDYEKQIQQSIEARLQKDASDAEIEAFLSTLSQEDLERWRYASWQERLDISASETNTVARSTPAPTRARTDADDDLDFELAEALRRSLQEGHIKPPSPSTQRPHRSPLQSASRSYNRRGQRSHPWSPLAAAAATAEDDDFAEAIALSLSLQDQRSPPVAIPASSSLSPNGRRESGTVPLHAEDEFPALGSSASSPALGVNRQAGRDKGKGKGAAPWK